MASYYLAETVDSDPCSNKPEVEVPSSLKITHAPSPQNK